MNYHLAIRNEIGANMSAVLNSFSNEEMSLMIEKSNFDSSHYWVTIWNRYLELKNGKTL